MIVELHPEAEQELLEAALWYDEQREGLGGEFLDDLSRWVDVAVEYPSRWPKWPDAPPIEPRMQRIVTDGFPFSIGFQVFGERFRILAFAHASRRPFYWAERAGS